MKTTTLSVLFLLSSVLFLSTIPVVQSLVMSIDLGNEFMKVSYYILYYFIYSLNPRIFF